MAKRLLREPLLHFALLGAALFGAYRLVAPKGSDAAAVVVSSGQIVAMAEQFRGTWQRPPTREELQQLIDARVRDEVLYREGVALGLDRDDPVVRNRVKQRVELLTEEALTAEPTDAELQAYMDAHREKFERPGAVSFEQIYFDPARHGAAIEAEARRAREVLQGGGTIRGDATMLPPRMDEALPIDVQTAFGAAFAEAVRGLAVGAWSAPVKSAFGCHLVRVTRRTKARSPTLAEARDAVLREWSRARTAEAKEQLYESLRARYTVVVAPIPETLPATASTGAPR